ncbi:hypothetical protein PPACK8108_LOCUS2538 [Phakopsora pachyrhizi]|uniref:Uncharacterized protein n=1 Tax=Phakopsora pachyrhizi TaxID=170000 RepID=A0AAV0ALU5_PHAPC|nr:hypothetical protein PPACK8108_LOCUS2538 [Phakopsora pachyrhizi]
MPALIVEHRVQQSFHPYQTANLAGGSRHKFTSSFLPLHELEGISGNGSMAIDCSKSLQFKPQLNGCNRPPTSAPKSAPPHSGGAQARIFVDDTTGLENLLLKNGTCGLKKRSPSDSGLTISQATAPAPAQPVDDIVSYLKTWRPPVEYYARRRYRQPYLLYPSRQPSLPILLEERVDSEGIFDLVQPELAMSNSSRARHRKHASGHFHFGNFNINQSASQGWDEEEDEGDDSEDSDDGFWSDSDSEEAITPTNSPISTSSYYLQPLLLIRPDGC